MGFKSNFVKELIEGGLTFENRSCFDKSRAFEQKLGFVEQGI